MGLKWSDLRGLAVGFGLVGVGVGDVLPRYVGALLPTEPPSAESSPPAEAPQETDKHIIVVVPPTRSVPLPSISLPSDTPPANPPPIGAPETARPRLPQVIGPRSDRAEPGHDPYVVGALPTIIRPIDRTQPLMLTGTGFFIAADGSVMTAAHVVKDCQAIQIASRYIQPSSAELLATDTKNDLALLRAANVRPPALLAFAARPSGAAALDIFGYPGGGDNLVPTLTRGTLRTKIPDTKWPDMRDLLWMDATDVVHGFSGGPVIGPGGNVVGVINGYVTVHQVSRASNVPDGKFTFGASTRMIDAFLSREAPAIALDEGNQSGATASETAYRATVHVYCTQQI
jgi:hypothetical protein